MFTQFKNIDTAFKHIKNFSLLLIIACVIVAGFAIYKSYDFVKTSNAKIYILANGKAIEAFSSLTKDNIGVEIKDHVKMFHYWFFTLDPDEKVINKHISLALNLADQSAKRAYDNLKEKGYYTNLIAANISQDITIDSIVVNIDQYPYYFKCYATQRLIRSSSTVNRSLVSDGYLRNVTRSDNNPHGLLIQRWQTLENVDLIDTK